MLDGQHNPHYLPMSWTITSSAYEFHKSFHSCQPIMHEHISTFTFNMSFYDQAMTHTSKPCNGHCIKRFISCQHVGAHTLTPNALFLSLTFLFFFSFFNRKSPHTLSNLTFSNLSLSFKDKAYVAPRVRNPFVSVFALKYFISSRFKFNLF